MKFRASRGGSAERAHRQSRESAVRHFERKTREEGRDRLATLKAAAKLAKQQVRDGCKHRRGDARLRAAEGRREVLRDVKLRLEEELAEIDRECARRMAEEVGPLTQSVEELAAELRASATARRHGRQREGARPKASAKERREETFDRVRHDLEAHDRRLLPIFERVKGQLKPTERQTMTEAFLELVAETPELVEQEQARVAASIADLDLHCAEALHEARHGNKEAGAWAAAHCVPRKRPKGSAASRTIGMFGPEIVPPTETSPKPSSKKTLSGDAMGASFLDVPF